MSSLDRSREAFCSLAAGARPAVVRTEAIIDVDVDPLTAYAALTGRTTAEEPAPYTFLLESAEKVASSDPDGAFAPTQRDRHARFSFIGYDPAAVVTVGPAGTRSEVFDDRYETLIGPADATDTEGSVTPDPGDVLDRLRDSLPDAAPRGFPDRDRQRLDGGLVGFLGYDAVYDISLDAVGVERPDSSCPDAQFVLTTRTLTIDHATGEWSLVFTPVLGEGVAAGTRYDELVAEATRVESLLADATPPAVGGFEQTRSEAGSRAAYEQAVEQTREHVHDGDIYQGVLSRTRELYGQVDQLGLYDALQSVNPSPYMYLLSFDDRAIVGASPETLVSVTDDRVVSNPIAGTCPRGASPVEDRRLAGELLADEKERAEHTMLVDLARNDVRRVAAPGSVRVAEFMSVVKYSHVQHIESTVTGRLASERDAFDAVRAAFPAGTLSGAPKLRAMEIIDELEDRPRGPYGGGVGYVSWTDDADFAIVIRSATIDASENEDRITVRAGAGIVADSDPAAEFDETEQKMDGVLDAVAAIRESAVDTADRASEAAGDRSREPSPTETEPPQ